MAATAGAATTAGTAAIAAAVAAAGGSGVLNTVWHSAPHISVG